MTMEHDLRRLMRLVERAYHGTPHKFDRFSVDHVGKGEGVQAYGYGLYFAGKREVAEFYRDSIGYQHAMLNKGWVVPPDIPKDIGQSIVEVLSSFSGQADPDYIMQQLSQSIRGIPQIEKYIKQLHDQLTMHGDLADDPAYAFMFDETKEELAKAKRSLENKRKVKKVIPYLKKYGVVAFVAKGHVYDVEIPEEDEFLLWDATLNKQPTSVTAALAKIDHPVVNAWRTNGAWDHVLGKALYEAIAGGGGITRGNAAGQKAASALLESLGIAGIKYFDAGSRHGNDGTYNYVVFNDERVSIQ